MKVTAEQLMDVIEQFAEENGPDELAPILANYLVAITHHSKHEVIEFQAELGSVVVSGKHLSAPPQLH
ncbi:hypothetical protein [Dongshaea marina]|uniref:hypothetical protein n=1 Tax=Dongshaea marina TaxID=2047966 RepID=UPI000D3E5E9C|nr:hypothetical protein [Dongshaea marina]